jgi:alpha-methylacyl-CoA racemase
VNGMTSGPLAGTRILDLGKFPPSAYCTQLLVQLGADVCRVESPGTVSARFGVGVGLSAGKRSVAVDLRHPRGLEVLRALAGWADVLVENNRPGELDDRGFGPVRAAEELPALIWCSLTGFGQDGPYAQWPGHDLTYSAHSGLLASLERELPWHPQTMLSVPLGALMAVVGITSALYDRQRTGAGCHLDISLAESSSWLLTGVEGLINGPGFRIPASPDRRLYECADGRFVSVAAADPKTWAALCGGLGLDDLAGAMPKPDEWETVTGRVASVFATRPAAEWVAELGPRGAAIGAVNSAAELAQDPHVQARGATFEVDGVTLPSSPVRFRGAEAPVLSSAPAAGAHTRAVLAEAGYGEAAIDGLLSEGAVAEA